MTRDGPLLIAVPLCRFETLFPSARSDTNVTFVMTANAQEAASCGASDADLPSSLSTGGFDTI